jgi:ABC-2 type transport system ATP-binding protein
MDAIIAQNVVMNYGSLRALDGLSLSVPKGKIFALLGPNGSGKSTLIRCFFGLLPFSGTIMILGKPIPEKLSDIYHLVGYMPQEYSLYEDLTVAENLRFFGNIYDMEGESLEKRIDEVCDLVKLNEKKDSLFRELSGGLKRRLSLATTLLHHPTAVIADEPTVGVDPVLRINFWDHFRSLNSQGVTILITTHIMDEVKKADIVGLIMAGKLIDQGTPQELLEKYNVSDIEDVFLRVT